MIVLFLSDNNMNTYPNMSAWIVQFSKNVPLHKFKEAEYKQPGLFRAGGNLMELLREFKRNEIDSQILKIGYYNDFKNDEVDLTYRLTSGNY